MPLFKATSPAVLVLNQTVGVGTTYTIDSSIITRPFVKLELKLASLSHNDAGSQAFRAEISGDNGSAWSSVHAFSSAVAAGGILSGKIDILNTADPASVARVIESFVATQAAGTNTYQSCAAYTIAGPINAIRISPAASSFDGGTVTLIGYPA